MSRAREETVALATHVQTATSDKVKERFERNAALDFTKGMLVLLMILYHWINYFISVQGDFYKYLRFITPSFIFITGFLVANVYLVKYGIGDPRLYKRLLQRGLKLLVLFTLLNLAESLLFARHSAHATSGLQSFLENAGSTFVTGNGRTAAFSVLVPISYVLIFAAGFLMISKGNRWALLAISLALFAAIYQLERNGLQSAHLELFAIGVLGMVLGQTPLEKVNRLARHTFGLLAGYAGYLVALNVWGEIYPLQIAGVCLSLIVIYACGIKVGDQGWGQGLVALLGRYSLLGYIVQMGVILILLACLRRLALGHMAIILSFVGAFLGTILIIVAVDRTRARSEIADKLYKTVFA